MQVDPGKRASRGTGGPLTSSEDMDQQGYAVPRDNLGGAPPSQPPPPLPSRALPSLPPSASPGGGSADYAQPISSEASTGGERRHHSRSKYRERREQLAIQQGDVLKRLPPFFFLAIFES